LFKARDLVPLVQEAAKLALTGDAGKVTVKPDGSPVTPVDVAISDFLIAELSKRFDHPILSEEALVPYSERKSWNEFFMIDPLDGTKEFISGNGEYVILLAFISRGRPIKSVIAAPALSEIYVADEGQGAFMLEGDEWKKLPRNSVSGRRMLRSRHHHAPDTDEFVSSNGVKDIKSMGSGLKFARLAKGEANLYPRFEGSSEWDIAAGHLLVKESGGDVRDLVTGKEPVYGKENLRNNPFLAIGPGVRYEDLKF
jgi:3'(2'), 5'-bisphosphate nucleotidase